MKLFFLRRHSVVRCIGMLTRIAIALVVCMPVVSTAAPSARIVASRVSGPAPLAVFFDATTTTDSNTVVDAFRQLGYRFTFGDPSSGTWQYSGRLKNEQIGGPLAAHVFEQAGTFTVQVEAKDASGASSVATVLITVQSPDAAFPGTRTVCLSRTTDFAGCPSGAQQLSNVASWPSFQSSTRYLLHRGQDFTSLGTLNFSRGGSGIVDGHIGPFGSGAKPLVGNVNIDSGNAGDSSWHNRVVVAELDAQGIVQDTAGFDLLLLRNSVTRGGMIDIASAFDYMVTHQLSALSWRNPENIFVVENNVDRNYSRDGNTNGITGNATRFAVMGNSVDRTWEHNIRVWQAHKALIAHNNLSGRCGEQIRGALKLHSAGTNPVLAALVPGVNPAQRSSQISIADNLLGSSGSNINWLAGSAPQNSDEPEGIEQVIWEDNQFRHGTNYFRDITWNGRNMTERGNRNSTDNTAASYGEHTISSLLVALWSGPYYPGQPSMKLRFSGTEVVRPQTPAPFSVL